MLEGPPSWMEILVLMMFNAFVFGALYWALHNRVWKLELQEKTIYPPGTVVVRRRRKYD